MKFVVALLFIVNTVGAEETSTKQNVDQLVNSVYITNVTIAHPIGDSDVLFFIPLNYAVKEISKCKWNTGVECTPTYRNIFAKEISIMSCKMTTTPPSSFTLSMNGTGAFLPIRIPVKICPHEPPGSLCWTNEHIWGSPTAIERILSCEYVAVSILVFWFFVACIMCACLVYNRRFFSPRQRFEIGEERILLEEESLELPETYTDEEDPRKKRAIRAGKPPRPPPKKPKE